MSEFPHRIAAAKQRVDDAQKALALARAQVCAAEQEVQTADACLKISITAWAESELIQHTMLEEGLSDIFRSPSDAVEAFLRERISNPKGRRLEQLYDPTVGRAHFAAKNRVFFAQCNLVDDEQDKEKVHALFVQVLEAKEKPWLRSLFGTSKLDYSPRVKIEYFVFRKRSDGPTLAVAREAP
jgi:hypothetical protein